MENIFAQQLKNLGTDYIDYYLLHILNTKFYNGLDGKGGVVKNCHLFEHAQKWKEEGKIRHIGFSFHDSPEILDQILTEHPEVEFVQIIIDYFDWESYFIASRRCYEVIRKHGKEVVIMEPVKGGVLAQIPETAEKKLRSIQPEMSPAVWALRFAGSMEEVIAVLSGMSTLEQVKDNVKNLKDFVPLTEDDKNMLLTMAKEQKEAGPEGAGDFSEYSCEINRANKLWFYFIRYSLHIFMSAVLNTIFEFCPYLVSYLYEFHTEKVSQYNLNKLSKKMLTIHVTYYFLNGETLRRGQAMEVSSD